MKPSVNADSAISKFFPMLKPLLLLFLLPAALSQGGARTKLPFPNFTNQRRANFGPPTHPPNEHCAPPEIGRISCLVVLKYVLALYSKQA